VNVPTERLPPLTIGDFSVMTRLSITTLRHYHEQGLLEPAGTDPQSGYRYYDVTQVQRAQVIRRLREVNMPIPEIREVLSSDDVTVRSEVIAAHLARMEAQLAQTQDAVGALRELLSPSRPPVEVSFRRTPATTVAAIQERVALRGISEWYTTAMLEIADAAGGCACGPPGGLYPAELFAEEAGQVTLFLPTGGEIKPSGRVRNQVLAPGEWAVAVHYGPHTTIDATYGQLATYVQERLLGCEGPARENYLPDDPEGPARTEICWPIYQTSPAAS
jgi:DNA-binding transcriptional MerR regulator